MLLTCERRASHDEHTLLLRLLALSFIHAPHSSQWERIAHLAPSLIAASLLVIVLILRVEEIRIGRVHPPCVSTLVEEILQVLPIDVASHRRESIIHSHSRRIIHARRPEG